MSEKKSKNDDDSRDVFDKALDYAPVAGGAALGILGGRALGRYNARRLLQLAKDAGPKGQEVRSVLKASHDIDFSKMTPAQRKAFTKNQIDVFGQIVGTGGGVAGLGVSEATRPRKKK